MPIANCSYSALTRIGVDDPPQTSRSGSPLVLKGKDLRTKELKDKDPDEDSDIYFEDLDNSEDGQFLRTEKRVAVRRSSLPKKAANHVKRGIIISVVLVSLGALGWMAREYALGAARFRLESSDNIEISGVQNASRAQVMDVVGKDISKNIFFIPLEEHKRQLEEIPWVESATVMRLLPNRLAVRIQERTPVAFVRMGPKISLMDAHGVVMGLAGTQSKYSFPVIEGITDNEPLSSRAAVMKIYNRLIAELDSGATGGPQNSGTAPGSNAAAGRRYSNDLSEVDFSDREDVKVTANSDAGGTVVIHLGTTDFLARYQTYVAHIAEWRQQYPGLQSVDMRYDGQVIVNQDAKRKSGDRVIGGPGDLKPKPARRPRTNSRKKAQRP